MQLDQSFPSCTFSQPQAKPSYPPNSMLSVHSSTSSSLALSLPFQSTLIVHYLLLLDERARRMPILQKIYQKARNHVSSACSFHYHQIYPQCQESVNHQADGRGTPSQVGESYNVSETRNG